MSTTNSALQQLLPVLVYIQSHLDDDLSLAQIAAQADLSPFHFHRLFHDTVGETPKQYTQMFAQLSRRRDIEIIGLPAIEIYRVTQINPTYELNHTDIYIPVRKLGNT